MKKRNKRSIKICTWKCSFWFIFVYLCLTLGYRYAYSLQLNRKRKMLSFLCLSLWFPEYSCCCRPVGECCPVEFAVISPTHKHTICPKSCYPFYIVSNIASTSDLKSVTISDVFGGYVLTCPDKASSAKSNHETSYFSFVCVIEKRVIFGLE